MVVAIIGILAAMLLPALSKAKKIWDRKRPRCVNNLHQRCRWQSQLYFLNDFSGRYCLTFQVTKGTIPQPSRAVGGPGFDFLLPYQKTTNLLLCPAQESGLQQVDRRVPDGTGGPGGFKLRNEFSSGWL